MSPSYRLRTVKTRAGDVDEGLCLAPHRSDPDAGYRLRAECACSAGLLTELWPPAVPGFAMLGQPVLLDPRKIGAGHPAPEATLSYG